MSPLVGECERLNLDYSILHTGQHYSYHMDRVFFEQLHLPTPNYNLGVGSGTHGEQTGKMLIGIEKTLLLEKPSLVLVQGDTNTVLAGALAAYKLGIRIGHVEAGLRSYDRRMPEEMNRVLTDHCSDYLFAPTETSRENLLKEGVPSPNVFVTGNTIVDAVNQNMERVKSEDYSVEKMGLTREGYCLATVHRQENVDDPEVFSSILRGLELVSKHLNLPVVYPVHPRAEKMLQAYRLNSKLKLIDPVEYFPFLRLERDARLVFTDSGGVQEEACILGVPCVTLRENTERPETIEVGANVLAGTDSEQILQKAQTMLQTKRQWENPFGDGKASTKILEILRQQETT